MADRIERDQSGRARPPAAWRSGAGYFLAGVGLASVLAAARAEASQCADETEFDRALAGREVEALTAGGDASAETAKWAQEGVLHWDGARFDAGLELSTYNPPITFVED